MVVGWSLTSGGPLGRGKMGKNRGGRAKIGQFRTRWGVLTTHHQDAQMEK